MLELDWIAVDSGLQAQAATARDPGRPGHGRLAGWLDATRVSRLAPDMSTQPGRLGMLLSHGRIRNGTGRTLACAR